MEGSTMDAELKQIEQLKEMIREIVSETFEPLRKRSDESRDTILQFIQSSKGVTERKKGLTAGRIIRAICFAVKGGPSAAIDFARKEWPGDEAVVKALSSSDPSAGGFLLREEVSAELIELLRPMSAVLGLNPRIVPLDGGQLSMPKITTGSSGGWIGENANAPKTEPVFGAAVLIAKKYASLVPVSNDLIRRGGAATEEMIRDDLTGDIGSATDLAFIRGDGTSAEPRGLRYLALAANITAANGTVNLANVTIDLGEMLQGLMDNNVKMIRPGWIFNPRQWRYLYTVQTTTGAFAFKEEMDRGTLFSFPFRITSQIPNNLGGGTESEVYLADFADVVVGQSTQILIDASSEAAYHDGSNVVAAFSLDQLVIRAIIETDIQVRHSASVAVKTTVKWGV